jgi:hypothetical protein
MERKNKCNWVIPSEDRILQLNQVAISQMKSLLTAKGFKFLK